MEITDAAVTKLKEIIKEVKKGDCLRIFMTEGCCGPSVAMDIAVKPEKDDVEFVKGDFKMYIHKEASTQVEKTVIDCDKNGEIVMTGLPGHSHGCGDSCGDGCGDGGCDCGH